jgi:transcriptional regulator with XRE-family HTH domain
MVQQKIIFAVYRILIQYIEQLNHAPRPDMASKKPTDAHSEPPRVGDTLAMLRQTHALSLDELSRKAGVSKSMLSQIERAQANPTVAVVWRLANALGVPIAELLGGAPAPSTAPAITLVPTQATPSLRSPDGLCELRILGPVELAGQFEWYELRLQPGGLLDSQAHEPGTREHLTVVSGGMELQVADAIQRLKASETARYPADCKHSIRNHSKSAASAWLVVMHPI